MAVYIVDTTKPTDAQTYNTYEELIAAVTPVPGDVIKMHGSRTSTLTVAHTGGGVAAARIWMIAVDENYDYQQGGFVIDGQSAIANGVVCNSTVTQGYNGIAGFTIKNCTGSCVLAGASDMHISDLKLLNAAFGVSGNSAQSVFDRIDCENCSNTGIDSRGANTVFYSCRTNNCARGFFCSASSILFCHINNCSVAGVTWQTNAGIFVGNILSNMPAIVGGAFQSALTFNGGRSAIIQKNIFYNVKECFFSFNLSISNWARYNTYRLFAGQSKGTAGTLGHINFTPVDGIELDLSDDAIFQDAPNGDFTLIGGALKSILTTPTGVINENYLSSGFNGFVPPPPTFPDAGKVALGVDRGDGTEGTRTDAPAADVRLGVQYGDPADLITGEFFCFELDEIQPTATEQSTVEYGATTDGFSFTGEISTVPATALTVTTPEPDKISFELPASVSAGNYTVSLERSDGARANTALSVLPLGFPAVDSITSPVNVGEILTIHGENFGALAGSAAVVVGGVCAAIVSWEDDKIEARPSLRIGSGSFGVVVVTQNGLCAQSADPVTIKDVAGMTDDINDVLFQELASDPDLSTMVTEFEGLPAIFAREAPETATMPYIVYDIQRRASDHPIVQQFTISVHYFDYGKTRIKSLDAAERIEFLLDRTKLQSARYNYIRIFFESGEPVDTGDPRDIQHTVEFTARAGRKKWADNKP